MTNIVCGVEKKPGKKRGRKPKGGKIVSNNKLGINNNPPAIPNVILHLKCGNSNTPNVVNKVIRNDNIVSHNSNEPKVFSNASVFNTTTNNKQQGIWDKINQLKINLHNNDIAGKRSDCFFCNESFDNPPIHLPKEEKNGTMEVYGCFCSPECACSYLKNEQLDDSTKWERYALLNNVYSKVYAYSKNIKPAPNPHYTLEKFYGNLSIQEYRRLLKNERILMVVDKPMTKVLPELYEENNEIPNIFQDILHNNNENKSNKKFRLQRSQEKKTKSNALVNNFNL